MKKPLLISAIAIVIAAIAFTFWPKKHEEEFSDNSGFYYSGPKKTMRGVWATQEGEVAKPPTEEEIKKNLHSLK